MPPLLPLSVSLADAAGREVIATISSDKPPQLVLSLGVASVRLPASEAERLIAWWQAWMVLRREGGGG